ncbi:MAG: hypothetical protein BGO07_00650 [Alphaproteobacteria bacterium 40-19]|nr:MAG: hypothetical protein BGO07_00650 [Alphaproteobacteria bacterium 40-19]
MVPQPKNDTELEAVGYKKLLSRIDSILMGNTSYKQIISFGNWAWPDKQTYVFASQAFESGKTHITATQDSPFEVILKIKANQSQKDIWLLGGARLAQSFEKKI